MSSNNEYGAWEWLRSHRVELGPAYLGTPVLGLGVGVNLLTLPQFWLLEAALAIGFGFWIRSARGWRRPYYSAVGAVALTWLVLGYFVPQTLQDWVTMACGYAVANVLAAIPWWSDNVRKTHVKMEMLIREWHVRAERIGLRDTWISNLVRTDIGWTAKLNWQPGRYDVDKVEKMRSSLEGALGLNVGELRMPLDGKSTKSINLVAIVNDPHEAAVMWEVPHTEVDGQLILKRKSIKELFDVGIREDGVRKRIALFVEKWGGRHVLVGGMTGSGKSGLLNLLWAQLSICVDVVQWGIDLKGGVELGPWRKCFDWVVDTRDDAVLMLETLNAEMDRRYRLMAQRGIRTWIPSAADPVIVLSIDEAASILGNAKASELTLAEDIARKGRAAGIILILATQYPTVDAIGTTQIREQIHFGFVFRMKSDKGEGFIITNDSTVDAHKIDENRPGTCYFQDGSQVDKMPLRCYFIDDEGVAQVADLAEGLAPSLGDEVEAFLAEVAEGAYANREIVPRQRDGSENESETDAENETESESEPVDWDETGGVSLDEVTRRRDENLTEIEKAALARERGEDESEPERLDETAALDALVTALREAGPDGARAKDLMAAATRRSSWLYERLGELEERGQVRRAKGGGWAWVRQDAHAE